jgi:AcrR family transcriptional regulator
MSAEGAVRKPRIDAQRNRERLIDAAKGAFAEAGPDVSLEEIARRAEVGIGTLYRHFPTRGAVVEAVYRREVQQLADAAERLLANHTPVEALGAWLKLFVDYMATKKVIAPALGSVAGGVSELYAASGVVMRAAVERLLAAAMAAGEIRSDVEAADVMQALIGFALGASGPDWEARTLRLIDIMMDGLRRQPPAVRPARRAT